MVSRKAVIAAIAVVCAVALVIAGWVGHGLFSGDFRSVDLPDGRRLVVLRNLEGAYPVYGNTIKAELDLALDQKQKMIDASAGGKYESQVQQLYQNLDAINADMRTAVVTAYSSLVLRLSATADASQIAEAFKKWDDVLQLIVKEAARIRSINAQIAAVAKLTSSGEWERLAELGREARQGANELTSVVKSQ